MSVKNCSLVLLASAALLVVPGYGGAAHAQAPAPSATNPAGPLREAPQGRQPPPSAAYTPSPEKQRELEREEEQSRKYGTTVFAPPHPPKHWGTANGRPPERYHRTAPPTPSSSGGGDGAAELG